MYLDLTAGRLKLRLTSAHIPHADAYEILLPRVDDVAAGGRRTKQMSVLGVDANAFLGCRTMTDDGGIIGDSGYGQRFAGRDMDARAVENA